MDDIVSPSDLSLDNKASKAIYKPKRKYPGFRKNFANYVQEYTDYTGIHGFKYMGEQDRSWFERLWWLVLFCISLYFCINLIIQTWIKWDASPVLVSFARSPTPVWQIPFPAITVCPETKSKQTVYNFTKAYNDYRFGNNMTDQELDELEDVSLLCHNHLVIKGKKYTNFDNIDNLMSKAPQLSDTLFTCKWAPLNEICDNMFTPMLTEEGLCFTFNMLDRTELLHNNSYSHENLYMQHGRSSEGWTLEKGYPTDANIDTFPRRALSAGFSAGLVLVFKAREPDLDYICRGPVQGFKIILHHPAEIPRVGMQYFRAPLNTEVVASVKPDMMTTSSGLKDYDPHRRQCYFQSERPLAFFQSYTQQNCQLECLRNYTLKRCGCVAYHMPRSGGNRICGSGSQDCMAHAQREVLEREVKAGITKFESENREASDDCDCLPSCTSLTYNAEISQADFDWKRLFHAYLYDYSSDYPGLQLTRLTIFFKEQQFITSERNELYGQTDFLANCGGILGLFTGISFLSIVEILYFLSLRLMCNVKMYGRRYWSGSSRLVHNDAYVHDK